MLRRLLVLVPPVVLALCLWVVPLPYFVEGPGPARDVLTLIDVDGTPTYEPHDRILFTTVNVGRGGVFDLVRAGLDAERRVVPEEAVIPPGITEEQYDRISLSQMDASKIAAVVSVLERFTDYPREHGPGVIVYETDPRTPGGRRLFPGDLITAVGSEAVGGIDELRHLIREAGAGRELRLSVRPVEGSGRTETVTVRTVRSEDGQPIIGIAPVANFPFEVSIQSGEVGGPSAGLMWALGVVDLLTPGDLGGGRTVAGTGEIDLEGGVHAIGGVGLKVIAAAHAGADVFLVPRPNLVEARAAGQDLEVVAVSSLDQALDVLEVG